MNKYFALYRITIEEIFQDVKYPHDKRFHNLKYIEKVADNIPGLTYAEMHSADTVRDISTTKRTVADLYEFVKQHDPEFNEGTTSSKVTETNGKPLIMYHGTRAENGEFYIFDESKATKRGGLYRIDYKDPPPFLYSEYRIPQTIPASIQSRNTLLRQFVTWQ